MVTLTQTLGPPLILCLYQTSLYICCHRFHFQIQILTLRMGGRFNVVDVEFSVLIQTWLCMHYGWIGLQTQSILLLTAAYIDTFNISFNGVSISLLAIFNAQVQCIRFDFNHKQHRGFSSFFLDIIDGLDVSGLF